MGQIDPTFCVIPPHWNDTGSWIFSWSKTIIYLFYIVNIMGADDLATQGARASATMILTMLDRINSVPARLGSIGIDVGINRLIWCISHRQFGKKTVRLQPCVLLWSTVNLRNIWGVSVYIHNQGRQREHINLFIFASTLDKSHPLNCRW